MTLTTHALIGAAAAELFPTHPILAFAAGFLSHFVLDAIPHRDYKLESYVKDRDVRKLDMPVGPAFWRDLRHITLDFMLGVALVMILFGRRLALLGAAGGVLPDALQFVFFKWKHEPLLTLQRFHVRIQEHRFPIKSFYLSAVTQAVLVIAAYGLLRYLHLV